MVRAIAVAFFALAVAGCGDPTGGDDLDGGGPTPDGGGDAGGGDSGGLRFELTVRPALPAVATGLTVDDVRVDLRDVRVIGDSAPGDSRTQVSLLSMQWKEGDDPDPLSFPQAPPGIYSNFGGRLSRFEIRGAVGGREFRIRNEEATGNVSVSLDGLTVGSEQRTAAITMALAWLADVPWGAGTDQIEIEEDDPRMPAIEASVRSAFALDAQR